jgi:hypothetical protein
VNANVSKTYIHQINAEQKESKRSPVTGRIKYFWKRVRKDNHLFDCEAMQVAMALVGGVLEDDTGAPEVPVQTTLDLTPAEAAVARHQFGDFPGDLTPEATPADL